MVNKIINEKIAAYWNKRGETYVRSWQSVAKKRLSELETGLVRKAITSVRSKDKKSSIKTLDIGIGIGRISNEILKHNVAHYGTDISETMIRYCQEKYRNNEKVRQLKIHDIHNPLPKEWGKFDIVTAYRVLSYTPLLKKQLMNIYNAMNKGGILIFTYPNKYSSTIFPKILYRKSWLGYEIGYNELKKIVKNAGFSKCRIVGFSRLLDTFYDKSNNDISANVLFSIEKFLSLILGLTLFVRLFYVTCKK